MFTSLVSAQSSPRLITTKGTIDKLDSGDCINMEIGRSAALQTDWTITDVSVADPAVADVDVLHPNEVVIVSKSMGTTDLILWGDNGEIWMCEIKVDIDPQRLNDDLSQLFPNCRLTVTRSEDVYFVKGIMQFADQVENLHKFFEVSGIKFVDMTKVAGLHQVQLKVRVAEVNRSRIRNMTINALYGSDSVIGASVTGTADGGSFIPFAAAHTLGNGLGAAAASNPLVNLFVGLPRADLAFFVQALAENKYVSILAEPTLIALSGEEANFLAGGEFPVPSSTGGNSDAIQIEFKEVGVRLTFRPEVLGDGTIRLTVDTEVSEISDFGAIEVEGFSIPSIVTRRVKTTLEMKSEQTFTMAGLLNRATNVRNTRVPLLGDLPVIGALFRSVSYSLGETELIIMVTPSLVEPMSYANQPSLPGERFVAPNDWELMALGKIGYTEGGPDSPDADSLNELKGPGAWDSNEEEK
ncbi:MAG: pilus assembly protein N-terminal domain-containing protein [Candidatus Hydrogenedentota bacterium]